MSYHRKFAVPTRIIVSQDYVPEKALISKDEGEYKDVEAKPERVMRDYISVKLTAEEMSAARIKIIIEHDDPILIETFGTKKEED